jgi:hypothetical protein
MLPVLGTGKAKSRIATPMSFITPMIAILLALCYHKSNCQGVQIAGAWKDKPGQTEDE